MAKLFKLVALMISTSPPCLSDYTGLCSVGMPALQISVGGGGRAKGTGGDVCAAVVWRRLIHKSPLTFRPSPFMPAGRIGAWAVKQMRPHLSFRKGGGGWGQSYGFVTPTFFKFIFLENNIISNQVIILRQLYYFQQVTKSKHFEL